MYYHQIQLIVNSKILSSDQVMKQSSTEIVNLVKEIISNQFKSKFKEEKTTHYSIKCNE